jgi:hypothetical protein
MVNVFTILLVLVVAYSFWGEGVHTAFCNMINMIVAGLIAFTFWEPLADYLEPMFANTFLEGYEDFISLIALAAAGLGGLRAATNTLVNTVIDYHPMVRQLGAGAFGALTGYLLAGFLICAFQTLPLHEEFMGFNMNLDTNAPNAKVRAYLPPDRIWLAFVHRASQVPFSNGDPPELFDPFGNFELRYARYRRHTDLREPLTFLQELKPKK